MSKSQATVWAGDEHLPSYGTCFNLQHKKKKQELLTLPQWNWRTVVWERGWSPWPLPRPYRQPCPYSALLEPSELAGLKPVIFSLTQGAESLNMDGTWARPDAPSQGQSSGWGDPRIFPGCRLGSGPAQQLWVAENSVLRLTSTPQWQGPYPLPRVSTAEPSEPEQGRTPPTWSARGPSQSSRPEMLWQGSRKEGAAQGEGCCTATGPLATTSPESSCHGNLRVNLCQKWFMWRRPLTQTLPWHWTQKLV